MEEYGDKKDDLNGEIEVGYDGSNVFGGFISLVIYFILFIYFIMRVRRVIVMRENEFDTRDVFYSPEEMEEQQMTLGKYDNSLNFMWGLSGGDMGNDDMDIFNNPYIEYHAYERTGGRNFYEKYELGPCSEDFRRIFLKESQLNWYE
jgi:hypothetical protein